MANRYWVGGTAAWDATAGTKWATTSGGAGGASVPGAADTAIFDVNSGIASVTCTLSSNQTVQALNVTGFRGTLAFGAFKISVSGNNMTVFSGYCKMSGTKNVELSYLGGSGTRVVTNTGGQSTLNQYANMTMLGSNDVLNISGSFGDLNFTGFSGNILNQTISVVGNLVFSPTMSFSTGANYLILASDFSGTTGTRTITSNGISFPWGIVVFDYSAGGWQLQDNLTISTTGYLAISYGTLDLNTHNLYCNQLDSNGVGQTRELKNGNVYIPDSNGYLSFTDTNFLSLSSLNVYFTYSGSVGTRSFDIPSVLYSGEYPSVYVTAGSDTFYIGAAVKNLDFTGFSGTLTGDATSTTITGNLTLSGSMTMSPTTPITPIFYNSLVGSGNKKTITSNGKTFNRNVTITGASNACQFDLLSSLNVDSTHSLILSSGYLNLNGFNVTTGFFNSSNTTARKLDCYTSTINLTGNGTVWDTSTTTNLTFNTGTSGYINIVDSVAGGSKTFNGGGLTFGNLSFTGNVTNTITFSGANTWLGDWSSTKTSNYTINLPASTTTTFGNWSITGGSGKTTLIQSTTAGTRTNLSKASGVVSTDYLSLKDTNATGGASWYAGPNTIDLGNNIGWTFISGSSSNSYFLMF